MLIYFLHWLLFTISSPTMIQYIHYRNTFAKKEKKIIQFSLTFTKIGTFGRDFLFSTCYHSLRKAIKQCSHSNVIFPSTNIRTTPLDKQANPFPIKRKEEEKKAHFPEGTTQETPLFLRGQCSASCAKVNVAPRNGSVPTAVQELRLWFPLNTAKRLWPPEPHVVSPWQHVLGSFFSLCSPCPCIICTLKV